MPLDDFYSRREGGISRRSVKQRVLQAWGIFCCRSERAQAVFSEPGIMSLGAFSRDEEFFVFRRCRHLGVRVAVLFAGIRNIRGEIELRDCGIGMDGYREETQSGVGVCFAF